MHLATNVGHRNGPTYGVKSLSLSGLCLTQGRDLKGNLAVCEAGFSSSSSTSTSGNVGHEEERPESDQKKDLGLVGKAVNLAGGVFRRDYSKVSDQPITQFGSSGSGEGEFDLADSVACNLRGDIVVGDCNNGRIQVFDRTGKFLFKIECDQDQEQENSTFDLPCGVTVDERNNQIVVSDVSNSRIQIIDERGTFLRTKESPSFRLFFPSFSFLHFILLFRFVHHPVLPVLCCFFFLVLCVFPSFLPSLFVPVCLFV